MCGIAGHVGRAPFDPVPTLRALAHRGPDAHGCWQTPVGDGKTLHLVHTRLKILDLSDAAAQPMVLTLEDRQLPARRDSRTVGRSDGGAVGRSDRRTLGHSDVGGQTTEDRCVMVFNGEIYNYAELRSDLASRGWSFSSTGDTEVLLKGYAEWGSAVFARCDGMFACAVYDGPRRRLVLARDHMGIKPLYWARTTDGGFVFASEVRALAGSGLLATDIDRVAVLDYLRLGSFQEPATIYAAIRAFPAAAFAEIPLDGPWPSTLDLGSLATTYWQIEEFDSCVNRGLNRDELSQEHAALLRRTVHEQLAADVPVGVFLSGGLDSSVLLELLGKDDRDRISAFTLGGSITTNDEAEIAARTCRNVGVRHTVVRPLSSDIRAWIADGLAAMDQPSVDGINTYLVSRASRSVDLIAVLSGCGADELHGAYGHAARLGRFIRMASSCGRLGRLAEPCAVAMMKQWKGRTAGERLQLMLQASPDPAAVLAEKRRMFTPTEIDAFWPDRPQDGSQQARTASRLSDQRTGMLESQITAAELRGYLRNTLLRDSDWATMGNSQELRVPYLGRRYAEFMLRVPDSMKHASHSVMKPLLAGLLSGPNMVLMTLPKSGFVLNYGELLGGGLREVFGAACAGLNRVLGFDLSVESLLGTLSRPDPGKRANRLWGLLTLGHYLRV